jgi:twitching motility protein PilT
MVDMADVEVMKKIEHILSEAKNRSASDIHIAPGAAILFRINGVLSAMDERVYLPQEVQQFVEVLISPEMKEQLDQEGELDIALSQKGFGRLRLNVFRQRGTYAIALRMLAFDIPKAQDLGLPHSLMDMTKKKSGLVLVTGPNSSGKSTTLAAIINEINHNEERNIITLEDPIEYLHKHDRSMVIQREVGLDCKSYQTALRAALRQDCDVIMIDELKDMETISTAILAAQSGHLVLTSIYQDNTADAIEWLIEHFPLHYQQQVRLQLSEVLQCVSSQILLPKKDMSGRVAAFEILVVTPLIRQRIRQSIRIDKHQKWKEQLSGLWTMEESIYQLYEKGEISAQTAVTYAPDPVAMQQLIFGEL